MKQIGNSTETKKRIGLRVKACNSAIHTLKDFESHIYRYMFKREGYEDIVIDVFFSKVANEIVKWKKNFPETYFEFINILKSEYFV